MKALQYIIVITAAFLCASLSSCQNPADAAKAAAIGNVLLSFGERHGVVTKEEADLVREAGLIVLTPAPPAVTASK